MKIKRLTRVIAIVLVIAMLPIWMLGCGKTTSTVSDRLVELMIGDGKLNVKKYEESKEYIERLDADVTKLRTYFDSKNGLWAVENMEPGSSYYGTFYENLYKMMTAWATKKSEHYHDRKIIKMVKSGLTYLMENPAGPLSESESENSKTKTDKERLDACEYLLRTLLIMRDKGKLSKSKAEEYAIFAAELVGTPYGKGVELARSTYICVAYSALIGDEDMLVSSLEKIKTAANTVTNGAGLYADGSYLADSSVAASGSYGVVAFSELVEIAYAIEGEACDFAPELLVPDYLYNWAINSIVPSLYNGRAFAATSSSFVVEAEYVGGRAVSSIIALSDYFEELDNEEKANELRAIVKGYTNAAGADFNAYLTTYGAGRLEDIIKDKHITPKTVEGAYNFATMDKLTVLGPKYSASLSMSSVRTAKYETRDNRFSRDFNSDILVYDQINGNGWYTGDGALLIYTATYAPDATYWKYVNGQRMPGTTVASIDRTASASGNYLGYSDAAGSTTLGNMAVASMISNANNPDYITRFEVKKSWFFFDDEIVALGAGINSNGQSDSAQTARPVEYSIETVIENIYYSNFTSLSKSDNYKEDIMLSANRADVAESDALYALNYGGIYAPKAKNTDSILKYSLKQTDGGNFVEIWLDHNDTDDTPYEFSGKTYEYVILPASDTLNSKTFFEYVATPGYTVLSNTEKVQAVKDHSSGAVGYAFWEAASVEGGLSANFACNVLVLENDTSITISVSDFTHTSADGVGVINLGRGGAVVSATDGISLVGTDIHVNRAIAANGNTLTIVINK